MTPNEVIMLICGFTFGAWTIAVWHMVLDMWDAQRSLARSERARKRAAGDQFLSGFRLYRLENRPPLPQPHPAEIVEASVRDFELKLWDAADRVEDAARRDGLL